MLISCLRMEKWLDDKIHAEQSYQHPGQTPEKSARLCCQLLLASWQLTIAVELPVTTMGMQ